MPDIRIRVSAVRDRSFDTIFRSFEEQGRRASAALVKAAEASERQQVAVAKRAAEGAAKAAESGAVRQSTAVRTSARTSAKAMDDLYRELTGKGARMFDPAIKAARDFGDETRRSFTATKASFWAMAKEVDAAQRRIDKGNKTRPANIFQGVGRAAISGVGDYLPGMARYGANAARNAALGVFHGAGFDPSVQTAMRSLVSQETIATQVSNSAFMPGRAGPNGQRVDPAALLAQAREIGGGTAFDPTKVLEGLQKFVAKTGDLQTGRNALKDMAVLSKATGTELDDMVDAAADVANALGDTDHKGEKVTAVMAAIAAQGKEGAVEIKDLASQMAKLGASATQFMGDPSRVIAELGAMAQVTRAKGGAASATQATTSVQAFTGLFSKPARLHAMQSMGVNPIDAATGRMRDPQEILLDMLRAAGSKEHGGTEKFTENMGKMVALAQARRATLGYERTYLEAGGGEAGIAAVRAEMDKLTNTVMKNTEVEESFRRAMETTESQSQLFNNAMQDVTKELKNILLPTFQLLAPAMQAFVGWLHEGVPKDHPEASVLTRARNAKTAAEREYWNVQGYFAAGVTPHVDENVINKNEEAATTLGASIEAQKKQLADVSGRVLDVYGGTVASGSERAGEIVSKEEDVQAVKTLKATIAQGESQLADMRATNRALLDLLRDGVVIRKLPEGGVRLHPEGPRSLLDR